IAEDTEARFRPWAGKIDSFSWPQESWAAMHTQVPTDEPYQIPTEFDPNLALSIITGADLTQAKERGVEFLNKMVLEGTDTTGQSMKHNIGFLRDKTANLLEF
ncbi:MAG: acetyl-CoA carboxylase biotin carboxylase subunit, partial [Proteobacteria bacterium]|nr:acetyl-CoA carboxylase biotin carboxylase subunit [Pseudomonadota bacterium]